MSKLKIITSKIKFWLLRLEAMMTKNSQVWHHASRDAIITRLRIGGQHYLYLSDSGKNRFLTMCNLPSEDVRKYSFSEWMSGISHGIEMSINHCIEMVKKNTQNLKKEGAPKLKDHSHDLDFLANIGQDAFTKSVPLKSKDKQAKSSEVNPPNMFGKEHGYGKAEKIRAGSLADLVDKFDSHKPNPKSKIAQSYNSNFYKNGFYGGIDENLFQK